MSDPAWASKAARGKKLLLIERTGGWAEVKLELALGCDGVTAAFFEAEGHAVTFDRPALVRWRELWSRALQAMRALQAKYTGAVKEALSQGVPACRKLLAAEGAALEAYAGELFERVKSKVRKARFRVGLGVLAAKKARGAAGVRSCRVKRVDAQPRRVTSVPVQLFVSHVTTGETGVVVARLEERVGDVLEREGARLGSPVALQRGFGAPFDPSATLAACGVQGLASLSAVGSLRGGGDDSEDSGRASPGAVRAQGVLDARATRTRCSRSRGCTSRGTAARRT